jgi:hypothetical protein
MVLITYDDNDVEAVKMIEDYYWFKCYLESLCFDWETFYYRERKQIYKDMYCDKKVCKIIIKQI